MITFLSTALAQTNVQLNNVGAQFGTLTGISLGGLVSFAINAILVVAAIIFFFMLIFGGLQWIMSGGDKANTEAARSRVTAAIVGLVIVFSAWVIASLMGSIFGINIFNLDFGNVTKFS